jgi:penicillin G amidase
VRWGVWFVAVAAALLVAVPGASARVVRAEGVLPFGQSGFVSLAGLTDGSGSPHLYDQTDLFTSFARKPLTFSREGTTEQPRAGVTIVRDDYGVPAITGGSEEDAWWGAGYAVAQDRLFQLELFRRATQGRLSEILGRDYLSDDIIARRDYYTVAEMEAMLRDLPARLQRRVAAYRDGINAWVAHVRTSPPDLPGEYAAVGAVPSEWRDVDSMSVGIFLARTVPSGDGNELGNLEAVKEGGRRVLEELLPLRIPGQVSTVPRNEGLFPQGERRTPAEERRALDRSLRFAQDLPLPEEAPPESSLPVGMIGRTGGSSMLAVRKKGGGALLFNGPQLGFSVPELFVELELHAPGYDIAGVTAPGVPLIGIGHNGRVAWGFTSGLSDEDDLYAEKLTGDETYSYKGRERRMECRDERFTYRSPPSDLLGGNVPNAGVHDERICRTVHGPVQARAGDSVAYARRYAIWGRELETFVGLDLLNRSRDVYDVDRAMRRVTWNENVMAADSEGNIGYWHPGLFQRRPDGWDERLPYPGTGEAEWPGLLDRRRTPHVINPEQGWLANWNNIPSQGWTTGDGESTERVTGALHRNAFFARLVKRLARAPSWEAAEATVRRQGTVAQQRPLLGDRLREAADGATGRAAALLGAVLAWDGDYDRRAEDGTVDPGVAAWQELKKQLTDRTLAAFGPAGRRFGTGTSSTHVYDISNGTAYAFRNASPGDVRAAAEAAFAELAKRFGHEDVARWRDPRRMYDAAAQGAGSPPDLPFYDRGTWEQIVELSP